MKTINCHICNNGSYFFLNKDGYDLYKCNFCHLLFVHPQPSDDFLANDLYSSKSGYQSNRAREDLSLGKELPRFRIVFDYFQKFKKNGNVLDIGCGNGQTMYFLKKRGFNPFGVELNDNTANSAKNNGLNVYNGFLEEAPFSKNFFDCIFLGEIIEHVKSPRDLISQSSSFLKKTGLIGITTPNINCLWSKTTFLFFRYLKIPWSSVTPPYHLFQFDYKNLDILMKDYNFSLKEEYFLRIPPLKYEIGMLHLLKRFKKSKSIKDLFFMFFSFGLYTITHFIFKILHPFLTYDFQMIKIYQKDE